MDRKGQLTLGTFITVFMAIIVAVALFITIAQLVGSTRDTVVYNTSTGDAVVTLAANGASVDLTGQDIIGTIVLHNASDNSNEPGSLIDDGNYTVSEIVSTTTGVKTISIQTDAAQFASAQVNASYTYGPDGYIENSGARSVALLVTLFTALAIAVVAMVPTFRSGILNMIGGIGGR